MQSKEQAIQRLLRPPSVANWARYNFRRGDETRKGLLRLAMSPPVYSLSEVYVICEAIVVDRISQNQALACIEHVKHPLAKNAAREIIPAFFEYARKTGLDGQVAFKGFGVPYPIGRNSDGSTQTIPVVPTFVVISEGRLKPIFLIGWATLPLNYFQKGLLSTIIRNAILTQHDFIDSDAEIIAMPRYKKTGLRLVRSWSARLYANLDDEQLQEQFERYGLALNDVVAALRAS